MISSSNQHSHAVPGTLQTLALRQLSNQFTIHENLLWKPPFLNVSNCATSVAAFVTDSLLTSFLDVCSSAFRFNRCKCWQMSHVVVAKNDWTREVRDKSRPKLPKVLWTVMWAKNIIVLHTLLASFDMHPLENCSWSPWLQTICSAMTGVFSIGSFLSGFCGLRVETRLEYSAQEDNM